MRLLCLFCSALPEGAIVQSSCAKTQKAGGRFHVLLEINETEFKQKLEQNGPRTVTKKVWSLLMSTFIPMAGGKQTASHLTSLVTLKVPPSSEGPGKVGHVDGTGQSWKVVWSEGEPIGVAVLLTHTTSSDQHAKLFSDAIKHVLVPLSGSDLGQISLLFESVLSQRATACISGGCMTYSEEPLSLWSADANMGGQVMWEHVAEELSHKESWLGRIKLASCMAHIPAPLQSKIVVSAVSDLREILRHQSAWAHFRDELFSGIHLSSWTILSPAERLAVSLVLSQKNSSRGENVLFSARDAGGQGAGRAQMSAAASMELLNVNVAAFQLVEVLMQKHPQSVLPRELRLPDPASTLVAIIARCGHAHTQTTWHWSLQWNGNARDNAAGAVSVYSYILKVHPVKGPQILLSLLDTSLLPKIIRELGPAHAVEALRGLLDEEKVCEYAVKEKCKQNPYINIVQLCEEFKSEMNSRNVSVVLSREILKYIVNEPRTAKRKPLSKEQRFGAMRAMCSRAPVTGAAFGSFRYLGMVSWDLLYVAICRYDLHTVHPTTLDLKHCAAHHDLAPIAELVVETWMRREMQPFTDLLLKDFDEIFEKDIVLEGQLIYDFMTVMKDFFVAQNPAAEHANIECLAVKQVRTQMQWVLWATKSAESKDPIVSLTNILKKHKQSIPVSFLRFIANSDMETQPDHSMDLRIKRGEMKSLLCAYRSILMFDAQPSMLEPFLPATREARSQVDALRGMKAWLVSLKVDKTPELDKSIQAWDKQIEDADLPTFPECLGRRVGGASTGSAVKFFLDDSTRSELVRSKARHIIRESRGTPIDPLELLSKSMEEARQFLRHVFAGESDHGEVKAYRRGLAFFSSWMKSEAKALRDLMNCRCDNPSGEDAFFTYLRLIQADPDVLVLLMRELLHFIADVLKIQAPLKLVDFCKQYEDIESASLPVFAGPVDCSGDALKTPSGKIMCVHHLVWQFRELIGCEESHWSQISLLSETAPLIEFFRGPAGKGHITKTELSNKMNTLRMMCVANRGLQRPVAALDSLLFYIFDVSKAEETQCIIDLLKSDMLTKAKQMLQVSHTASREVSGQATSSTSVFQLVHLFRLTESAANISNSNFEALKSAKIVISVDQLRTLAEGKDPFSQIDVLGTVSIQCGKAGASDGSCSPQCFQLAGGRTSCSLEKEDMHALFVETMVQISVSPNVREKGSGEELRKIQSRLKRILGLAELYHECASLGKLAVPTNCGCNIEFTTQPQESGGSLFYDETEKETSEVQDIDQNVTLLREQSLPWSLCDALLQAKMLFPWLSFCPKIDVMRKRKTPWLDLLSLHASHFDERANSQTANEISLWAESLQNRQHEGQSHGHSTAERQIATPSSHVLRARVAAVLANDAAMMAATVSLLSAVGEWPQPSPTALFPCDVSAVASAVHEFAWRLNAAAQILETSTHNDKLCEISEVIRSIFLSSGVIVTRPDLLEVALQDVLLTAVDRYSRAAPHAPYSFPKVCLIFPDQHGAGGRFRQKFEATNNLIVTENCWSDFSTLQKRPTSGKIVVCGSSLESIICGVRPKMDAYRIRMGCDMSVQDLVASVSRCEERSLCLDFGGDIESVLNGPMAGALVSILTCRVLGQAQCAVEVLPSSRGIFIECAIDSLQELVARMPVFSLLSCSFVSLQNTIQPILQDASARHLDGLIRSSESNQQVSDKQVILALQRFFREDESNQSPERHAHGSQMPFVHSARSLRVMAQIADRVKLLFDGTRPRCAPVLLSGDTGTGKTYVLLKFLELLRTSCALPSLDPGFLQIYTLSAAFRREHVEFMGKLIRDDVLKVHSKGASGQAKVCPVVLDEITGSSAQEVLSRLICYRETKDGESQPLNDTLILATCNPDPARDSVFPLTPELQRAAIVAEPLSSDIERERFIVSQLQDKVRGPGLEGTDLSNIKALVSSSQRAVESVPENERIGTISLRDSVRCASLMKRLGQGWSQLEGNPSFFQTLEEHAPPLGWAIDDEKIRVAAVACYVCYGMRVLPRTKYFSALRDSKRMEQLVEEVKEALIRFLSLPPTVVVTSALQDNILAILIAVSAKLPLLCLGDDGTSKTLSLNLVLGQMQGRFSSSQLLRSLMRAQAFHLQLSEASTAKHIVSLKKTVVSWHTGNMVLLSNPCVCMEEMSMADPGPSGPLRALHDLLDSHQESRARRQEDIGTGSNTFSFIATSNYHANKPRTLPTGRALGNRLLVLAHDALPEASLIELAVQTGLGVLQRDGCEDVEVFSSRKSALEDTVTALCSDKTTVEGKTSRLVPDLISIRSLLYLSKALASLLASSVSPPEAQIRALASHLQLETLHKSKCVWDRVIHAMNWPAGMAYPTIETIVGDAFGCARTRRPLLFLYSTVLDVHSAIDLCVKAHAASERAGQQHGTWLICPASQSMVQRREESSQHTISHDLRRKEAAGSDDVLHSLVQLRSALQAGGTIFVLNPEPILDGIHALLNDAESETSTIQMRQSSENVVIHPSAQIVLLVERTSSVGMHRALLSRVAVVNSGLFNSSSPLSPSASVYTKLKSHYDSFPGLPEPEPDGQSLDANSDQEASKASLKLYDKWRRQEKRLLDRTDMSLNILLQSLHPAEQDHLGQLYIALTHGPIPLSLSKTEHIKHVDAAVHSTPSDFMGEVRKSISEIEASVESRRQLSMLLLDLTAVSLAGAIECLALMGFSGFKFLSPAAGLIGDSVLRHAARQDCRVIIALDVASKCIEGSFPLPETPAWTDDTEAPTLSKLVTVVEVRNGTQPFPEWPRLQKIVQDPSLMYKKTHELLLKNLTLEFGTSAAGDGVSTEHADTLRSSIADIALRYCFAREARRLLFVAPDSCVEDESLFTAQIFTRSLSSVQATPKAAADAEYSLLLFQNTCRIDLFQSLVTDLVKDATCKGSLRGMLINMCKELCSRVTSLIFQRCPSSFFSEPVSSCIDFTARILRPSVLLWQRNAVPVSHSNNVKKLSAFLLPSASSAVEIPFFQDFISTVIQNSESVCEQSVSQALSRSFPTFKDYELTSDVSFMLARSLVRSHLAGQGVSDVSVQMACKFLMQDMAGGQTIAGQIVFMKTWEAWLQVAALVEDWDWEIFFAVSNAEGNPDMEGMMLSCTKRALGRKASLARLRIGVAHAIDRALVLCTSRGGTISDDGVWLRQVVRLWIALSHARKLRDGENESSMIRQKQQSRMKVSTQAVTKSLSGEECSVSELWNHRHKMEKLDPLELAVSLIGRNYGQGTSDSMIAQLRAQLLPLTEDTETALHLLSALDVCYKERNVPKNSLAAILSVFPSLSIVHRLISSSAARRGRGNALGFVIQVLAGSLLCGAGKESMHVALREETVAAAKVIRNLALSPKEGLQFLGKFKTDANQSCPEHVHAARLAVAAFTIPDLVKKIQEYHAELCASPGEPQTQEYQALCAEVQKALRFQDGGGEAIRNFLVRCLSAVYGERSMFSLSSWLPMLVGKWVKPYLEPILDDQIADVSVVEGFQDEHVDVSWPFALSSALRRAGGRETSVAGETAAADGRASAGEQEMSGILIGVDVAAVLMTALQRKDLSFCAVPVAMWCVMLETLCANSVLASQAYKSESGLNDMYVPGAESGPMEMLSKLAGEGADIRSINQCTCGYIYAIGHCGMTGEIFPCPDCKKQLGGHGHTWAEGVSHQVLGPQTERQADDMVKGIKFEWFSAGQGYKERELSPLSYRVLCVLLLIPLAVYSPHKTERTAQLKRHWDALKDASGLPADIDAQHFVLGLLNLAAETKSAAALGMSSPWSSVQNRADCERAFMQGLEAALGFSTVSGQPLQQAYGAAAGGVRQQTAPAGSGEAAGLLKSSVRRIVDHVQQKLNDDAKQSRALVRVRDGEIARLRVQDAAFQFAPKVLMLSWPNECSYVEDCMEKITSEVVSDFDSFPALTRVLFSAQSEYVARAESLAKDLDLLSKLEHLPSLVRGLVLVHARAADCSLSVLEQSVKELLANDTEIREELSVAWDACRYGNRIDCQEASDLGDILELRVMDVVWFCTGEMAGVGMSRTEVLLGILVQIHNSVVEMLVSGAGELGREGTDKSRSDAGQEYSDITRRGAQRQQGENENIKSDDRDHHRSGLKTVYISAEPSCPAQIQSVIFDFVPARSFLDSVVAVLPAKSRAKSAESLVRAHIGREHSAWLSLTDWPRVMPAPDGMIRISSGAQASRITAQSRSKFELWIQRNGLQEDQLRSALDWAQRLAAKVDMSRGAISGEVSLIDFDNTASPLMQVILATNSSVGSGKGVLCTKHLNALQEYLAQLMDVRPESSLGQEYRVELEDREAFIRKAKELTASDSSFLLRKLVAFATQLHRNAYNAEWPLSDCLGNVSLGDGDAAYDDDATWQVPVEGLQNRHIYHALCAIRAV